MTDELRENNLHTQSSLAVDMIMKNSLARQTFDNITSVFIAFYGFETSLIKKNTKVINKNQTVSPRYSYCLTDVNENREDNSGINDSPKKIMMHRLRFGNVDLTPKAILKNSFGKFILIFRPI
jgi:hypothetical protein